ncbi:hypothetical protein [Bifidobacterium callitrichidarum]|uniref:Restriction alleviation protein, Lar family n=1 Tax=Bifidobacterium callitrichidarum TaxID=2052941 RepID=A0A2U2N078_9BIFI|nr:hypothetical protein [Bifidobacterium callitrichidarum]PWG62651.1 hypothetical protein DF196_11880 [Bifidobacterium callitrichidarum]
MEHPWFCPHCGRSLEMRRTVDNATGRIGWRVECPATGHFRTPVYATKIAAAEKLKRLFGSPEE